MDFHGPSQAHYYHFHTTGTHLPANTHVHNHPPCRFSSMGLIYLLKCTTTFQVACQRGHYSTEALSGTHTHTHTDNQGKGSWGGKCSHRGSVWDFFHMRKLHCQHASKYGTEKKPQRTNTPPSGQPLRGRYNYIGTYLAIYGCNKEQPRQK